MTSCNVPKFTDSITGHYGTRPCDDLRLGLAAALQRYSYIDGNRAVALAASYGGYMIISLLCVKKCGIICLIL